MEQLVEDINPHKRGSESMGSSWDRLPAKRTCVEASSSPHLKLLEDFCELEAEDNEAEIQSPSASCSREDLVAEMMKSLEKFIEDGESVGAGEEASTRSHTLGLDFEWGNEESSPSSESLVQEEGASIEVQEKQDFQELIELKELVHAAHNELNVTHNHNEFIVSQNGLNMPSSLMEPEEIYSCEEWASLVSEGSMAESAGWLRQLSSQPFDEGLPLTMEMYEPLLLF